MGLFAMPVGPVVGAVVGAVVGVRRLGGVIAVVCGAGIGAVAGLLAVALAIPLSAAFAVLAGFISHEGPFQYLARAFELLALAFHYLIYDGWLAFGLFLTASGASVGIGTGVIIGRRLRRQKTVI